MAGNDFLRILIASVVARCVSLSLNFAINNRLVFSGGGVDARQWRTFARFLAVAIGILALSSFGVWWAHTALGAPEWQAKIVVDVCLFFLNYSMQRVWVFKNVDALRSPEVA